MSRAGRAARGVAAPVAALVGVLVGAVLALPLVAVGPGAGTAVATEHRSVDVQVTAMSPQVLGPGEDLRVRVELTNDGAQDVEQPRLLLHLDRRSFISRSSLDRWRTSGTSDPVGSTVALLDLEAPLPAGTTTTATVVLPATSVGLGTGETSWGPRGVAVEAVDLADPARARLGLERTFLLWFPVREVTPTRLSVLVPLVGPRVDPYDDAWVAELEELTAADGRLTQVLDATAGHPDVTWVLDPWLVEVTTADPDSPAPDATEDDDGSEAGTTPSAPDDAAPGGNGGDGDGAGGSDEGSGDDGSGDGGGTDGRSDEVTVEEDADGEADPDGAGTASPEPLPGPVTARAGEVAQAWAAELLAATTGRDVELLPYLDPDLAALAHADETDLLDLARDRAGAVVDATALPDGARTTLAWPAEPLPDLATAGVGLAGTASGTRPGLAVLVGPGRLPPPAALTYTPSNRTTVSTPRGDVTLLVPDARVSAALRAGDPLDDPAGTLPDAPRPPEDTADDVSSPSPPTAAVATQDLLAELAVVTRERPSDSRHLLATLPRDWAPDPDVVDAQLSALDAAPWVRLETVAALVGAPDPDVDRGTLPDGSATGTPDTADTADTDGTAGTADSDGTAGADDPAGADGPADPAGSTVDAAEIPPAELRAIADEVLLRQRLATVVPSPDALLGDTDLELLAPVSVAWRAEPTARSLLVARAQALTQGLRDGVVVEPGSTVNLISATGGLPVRLTNHLPQDATVQVTLRPGDSRLRADDAVTTTVPAGGEQTVQVPVHAIQSADVDVAVEVRTPTGDLLDDDTVMLVRVRADWEGIGTAVIAGVLALGMVIGLVRAVRRGRTTGRRAQPQRESGPDALSPEADAPGTAAR